MSIGNKLIFVPELCYNYIEQVENFLPQPLCGDHCSPNQPPPVQQKRGDTNLLFFIFATCN
tara:strand:+ start:529 stop:711 length:183 start_codon:yes stop_codon:yes gene_type:complete